jgi:dTDP-4-dehydrorhamnose reductase
MRILLTGAAGQVGWELQRSLQVLGEVIAVERTECDLSRPDSVRAAIELARPDLLVNAAAYTGVDRAEAEPALAHAINADAPALMAELMRKRGGAMVHYSTDYVFDGTLDRPYVEGDVPNPLSVYGRSKLAGERAIIGSGVPNLILRTSWVYAARGQNFLRTILKLAREREVLRIVDDQIGAPTWARTLSDATLGCLLQCRQGRDFAAGIAARTGAYHVTAQGATSWFGFAQAILREVADPARRLRQLDPIPSREYPTAAKRPLNSRLGGERLALSFGLRLPPWETALALCARELVQA